MLKPFMSWAIMASLLLLSPAAAASPPSAAPPTLIRNVTIFDATGADPFIADVEVTDGRISAIGTRLPATRGTTTVNAEGLSLLPGLIDVHVHWTGMGGVSRAETATLLLQHGVTTATDFHSTPESFGPKRAWHEQLLSPHVVFTARTSTPGGHGADWGDASVTRLATSAREGRSIVGAIAPHEPEAIKVFADGWRYGSGINRSTINIDALSAIVDEAKSLGLPVVTHTVSVDGAKTAAAAGVTALVHAIQDRRLDDELVELMQESGIFYAPTLAVYEPREDRTAGNTEAQMHLIMRRQEASRYNFKRLIEAGIPVALGTDAGISATAFGESTLRELELLVEFGLTPQQALIAGTSNSASILGLSEDRGTIEVGKRADFVLVKGKPWEQVSDYRNLEAVYVDGRRLISGGELTYAQGPDVPPAGRASALIDDFERPDGLTAGGAARMTEAENGYPRSTVISQLVTHQDGGTTLLLSANLSDKETPKALIVLPLSPGSVIPANASAFSGVRFDVRGDGGPYRIELVSQAGTAEEGFSAGADWQTLEIPFTAFEDGFSSADALYAVKLGASRTGPEAFWLEIDNVGFY